LRERIAALAPAILVVPPKKRTRVSRFSLVFD
jgi:hypothetical protein